MSGHQNEQRKYHRYPLSDNMYCYIDGSRFDARSLDISAGGLFLRTPRKVPLDCCIALVFKDKKDPGVPPVFLVGRVMRHQVEPEAGIGLKWDRAITEGNAAHLELFLTLKMGVIASHIEQETVGPRKEVRHYFDFSRRPGAGIPGEASTQPAPTPVRTSPEPAPTPLAPREKLRVVEPVHVVMSDGQIENRDAAPLPEHVVRLSDAAPGPLSSILQRGDSLAPVTLEATVFVGGREVQGTIRGMSVKTMFLTGVQGLGASSRPFKVVFRLPAKAGWHTITCKCRALYEDPGGDHGMAGLEVEIDTYDEGDAKGILWTYLKWVTFRQIRGQDS